jgi:hypothetical protein
MKAIGILILAAGLALGVYALAMDVGIEVPSQDFGYGVKTPAMHVANVDRMAQRQNYLLFAGVLSIVGAILTGFASMRPAAMSRNPAPMATSSSAVEPTFASGATSPTSVSICPKCRHMGSGDACECARCGAEIAA